MPAALIYQCTFPLSHSDDFAKRVHEKTTLWLEVLFSGRQRQQKLRKGTRKALSDAWRAKRFGGSMDIKAWRQREIIVQKIRNLKFSLGRRMLNLGPAGMSLASSRLWNPSHGSGYRQDSTSMRRNNASEVLRPMAHFP
jgi:hypothetical protein